MKDAKMLLGDTFFITCTIRKGGQQPIGPGDQLPTKRSNEA